MFTVINSYVDPNGTLLYAVQDYDTPNSDLEIITEDELKLLVSLNLPMKDINNNILKLDGDNLNVQVEDITEYMAEDEDYDDPEEYDEDDYEDTTEEDDEDYEDEEDYTEEDYDDYEDDYDDEYIEEDEDPEGSVVSKLYELLNEDQIKVLRRYYLWYSQRLFEDAQKDPTMGFKNKNKMVKKRDSLNQIRADGDWRYAGFLDTGSRYAGYTCSLGHPLRYMHLAWDITVGDVETCFFGEDYNIDYESVINSNNCVIFGIKCIGDFFEVDSDCIKSLQRAQRDSLKDMSILYELYSGNNVDEIKNSFNLLDTIVEKIAHHDAKFKLVHLDTFEFTIPASMVNLYKQFRDADLVPPKSLIQEIRSCMVGWSDGKHYFSNKWAGELRYPTDKFKVTLKAVLGNKSNDFVNTLSSYGTQRGYISRADDVFYNYSYLMFAYECCGFYKYDAETNKDEGGRSKPVKYALSNLYKYNTHNLFDDFEFSLNYLKTLFQFTSFLAGIQPKYPISIYKGYDYTTTEDLGYSYSFYSLKSIIEDYEKETGQSIQDCIKQFDIVRRYFRDSFASSSRRLMDLKLPMSNDKLVLASTKEGVESIINNFVKVYNDLESYVNDRNNKIIAEEMSKKLEEEAKAAEKKKEQEEAERKALEAQNKMADINTPKKVVDYLKTQDLSNLSKDFDFPKQVLDTLIRSGKEPSDKQFRHIKRLFEEVTKVKYSGVELGSERVKLIDRDDIKNAIDWCKSNRTSELDEKLIQALGKNEPSDKIFDIFESIQKYGTISERQMKYALAAKQVYEERTV